MEDKEKLRVLTFSNKLKIQLFIIKEIKYQIIYYSTQINCKRTLRSLFGCVKRMELACETRDRKIFFFSFLLLTHLIIILQIWEY